METNSLTLSRKQEENTRKEAKIEYDVQWCQRNIGMIITKALAELEIHLGSSTKYQHVEKNHKP